MLLGVGFAALCGCTGSDKAVMNTINQEEVMSKLSLEEKAHFVIGTGMEGESGNSAVVEHISVYFQQFFGRIAVIVDNINIKRSCAHRVVGDTCSSSCLGDNVAVNTGLGERCLLRE